MTYLDDVTRQMLGKSWKEDRAHRMAEDPLDEFEREALNNPPLSPADKRILVVAAAGVSLAVESFRLARDIKRGEASVRDKLAKSALIGISGVIGAVSFAQFIRLDAQETQPEIETDH